MKLNLIKKEIGDKKKRVTVILPRYILIFIGSLILGMNLYIWNGKNLAGNALPMPFGYGMAVVLSGSMEPVLSTDDLVVIHRQKSYEVGDIIVYQSGRELIIHRIVEAEEDELVTKGDANHTTDPPIDWASVKGKMIVSIPGIGILIRGLKTPAGVLLVLTVAFILLELSYRREWKEDKVQQQRLREEIEQLKEELEEEEKKDRG